MMRSSSHHHHHHHQNVAAAQQEQQQLHDSNNNTAAGTSEIDAAAQEQLWEQLAQLTSSQFLSLEDAVKAQFVSLFGAGRVEQLIRMKQMEESAGGGGQ